MPVAIETVIIVIVVISIAVLSAVVCALYWLWRLLLEERRCSRIGRSHFHSAFPGPAVCLSEDGPQRALLTPQRNVPRISRRREMFVDERSRRMTKISGRCAECPGVRSQSTVTRTEDIRPPEVVVLDGTEPPPPYEPVRS